ncbi:hypothetical protein BC936DRAFT_141482 [Jimgerdemannia flammicorona]|uniref:Uncharacterized protein n=1 Tax=Jimgerdemannia flammicorona TaxID=994334 RepID=A0A433A259_9FUNG|nr:hypothetical protein BC936DRAFT_141482 [Jimgerdemannia flammicorona]
MAQQVNKRKDSDETDRLEDDGSLRIKRQKTDVAEDQDDNEDHDDYGDEVDDLGGEDDEVDLEDDDGEEDGEEVYDDEDDPTESRLNREGDGPIPPIADLYAWVDEPGVLQCHRGDKMDRAMASQALHGDADEDDPEADALAGDAEDAITDAYQIDLADLIEEDPELTADQRALYDKVSALFNCWVRCKVVTEEPKNDADGKPVAYLPITAFEMEPRKGSVSTAYGPWRYLVDAAQVDEVVEESLGKLMQVYL